MEITKKDLLFVYDVSVHRRFQREGFTLLSCAVSLADRRFWLYQRTPETEKVMKEHTCQN